MRESKICKNPKCQKEIFRNECNENVIKHSYRWDELLYCSPQCMRRYVSNENRKRNRVGKTERSLEEIFEQQKKCCICDTIIFRRDCEERTQRFDSHWEKIKYCSDRCRRSVAAPYRKKVFENLPKFKQCKECGSNFERKEKEGDGNWAKREFCSKHCGWKFNSKTQEQRKWKNKRIETERKIEQLGISFSKICEFCKTSFERDDEEVAQVWLDRKYCSISCRYKSFYERSLPDDAARKIFYFQTRALDAMTKVIGYTPQWEKTFDWLKNPKTGYKLRCDGYYEKDKLIVECQGEQHFNSNVLLDKKYDFEAGQYRDKVKKELILQNEFKLIEIRYDEELSEEVMKRKLLEVGIIK